jgi:hypothetical protein
MKYFSSLLLLILLSVLPFSGGSVEDHPYFSSLLPTTPGIYAGNGKTTITAVGDTVSTGQRDFGPFVVKFNVTNAGYKLNCSLTLGGSLVGLSTLTSQAPVYEFNTISNKNKAWGTLTVLNYPPNQISTLEGNFYVLSERSDTIRFKGTVAGWYTTQQVAPQ